MRSNQFSASAKVIFSALIKRVYPISVPMQKKPAEGNPAKHKRNHAAKLSTRVLTIVSKTNGSKEETLWSPKKITVQRS